MLKAALNFRIFLIAVDVIFHSVSEFSIGVLYQKSFSTPWPLILEGVCCKYNVSIYYCTSKELRKIHSRKPT